MWETKKSVGNSGSVRLQLFLFQSILLSLSLLALFVGSYVVTTVGILLIFLISHPMVFGLVTHPSEIPYMLSFYRHSPAQLPKHLEPNQLYCYTKLMQVSRSFSAVILCLPEELREAICLFYLVCRAIDTVEDDMKPSIDTKVVQLRTFVQHLREPGWTLKGYGDKKNEIELLEQFDKVIDRLLKLKPEYQQIIYDVANEMGNGMADFLQKRVITMEDYNQYCWYVAGLVGEGLSRLFAASKLEDEKFADVKELYNSMGLFLQKTNITRDYKEDLQEQPPRVFYPKAIWSEYANDIADFKDPQNIDSALKCLNHMVTDAMGHAADCLDYLEMIKDPAIFQFCAIPQVMAIATLYECYNNPDVFQKEVKIRKSLAIKMIMTATSFKSVLNTFYDFSQKFLRIIPKTDPNAYKINKILQDLIEKIQSNPKFQ